MASKTTDRDLGQKRIMRDLRALKDRPYVKVGVLAASGNHSNEDGTKSDMSVADIATVHEYGSSDGRVPERSFIRTTMDENEAALLALTARVKKDVILNGAPVLAALSKIGVIIRGLIQKKIASGDSDWPELAQSTIDAKGSSKPLIDTGQLRQSINYEVVEGGD